MESAKLENVVCDEAQKCVIWFEHMYQPSWNFVKYNGWDPARMIEECYRPNARLLKESGAKINMNITQTMYSFLKENNAYDIISIYRELASEGKLEITGSTAHHVFATKRYKKVLNDEIREQHDFVEHCFGQSPQIFFPPEMAIDHETEDIVMGHDYKGLIVSGGWPNFSTDDTTGVFKKNILIFPHNRKLSSKFAFPCGDEMESLLDSIGSYSLPVLIAFDHETFGGYHNTDRIGMKEHFFRRVVDNGWKFVHFSELVDSPANGEMPGIIPSTWVGDYSKWQNLGERDKKIDEILENISTPEEYLFARKWILPSCHLHSDYATDAFWVYAEKFNNIKR